VVVGRIVGLLIDAKDDGDVLVLRRGGDDDLLDAAALVSLGLVLVGETTGRLDDDLGADLFPRDEGRVLL